MNEITKKPTREVALNLEPITTQKIFHFLGPTNNSPNKIHTFATVKTLGTESKRLLLNFPWISTASNNKRSINFMCRLRKNVVIL